MADRDPCSPGSWDPRSSRGGAHGWSGGSAVLAEVGTLQVEFRYLAAKTGKAEYAAKANRVFEVLSRQHPAHGLYPIYVRNDGGTGEREDDGPGAVARQEQRLRAVPDIHDQKRDGGGAAAAVRED